MKPCPHCQAPDPVVYEDALYCGACNTPYPVTKRVYVLPDFKAGYIQMRDYATGVLEIVQNAYVQAGVQSSPEVIELYQETKELAEKYDEWGNG